MKDNIKKFFRERIVTMTPYDQLKSIIQKANPESFVCKSCNGQRFTTEHANDQSCNLDVHLNCPVQVQCIDCEATGENSRPIRLADVLLALTKGWTIDENKHWVFFGDEKQQLLQVCANWNLKDDNLDRQSEECKEFLIKLLVNDPG